VTVRAAGRLDPCPVILAFFIEGDTAECIIRSGAVNFQIALGGMLDKSSGDGIIQPLFQNGGSRCKKDGNYNEDRHNNEYSFFVFHRDCLSMISNFN
jgi:hypothetical protein